MLTALEGVGSRGQQSLSEMAGGLHLALAQDSESEMAIGRAALMAPEGLKLPIVDKTPLPHQAPP